MLDGFPVRSWCVITIALVISPACAIASQVVSDSQLYAQAGNRSEQHDLALKRVLSDIGRMQTRLELRRQDYAGPARLFSLSDVRRQYEEATFLYLVEEYEKAALLFYSVIENAERGEFPEFEDAEFYLADCLMLDTNYYPSLQYFSRIVEYGPSHRFYDSAVLNMVELYGKVGDARRFESYYTSYIEQNKGVRPTNSILYALGKSFYVRRKYAQASDVFKQLVNEGGIYPFTAGYYLGVISVAMGDMAAAKQAFGSVLALTVGTPEQQKVEDLAYLALGRIHYEEGDLAKALESYAKITRESEHFADALYEQSWTFINRKEFEQAIRVIDILLLTYPDHISVPRLKLVRGILQQRRGEFDDALDTYQSLVDEYSGIKQELDEITGGRGDILSYFKELIETDVSSVDATFVVPALAVRNATSDELMMGVMNVARDAKIQLNELKDAARTLEEIRATVESYDESQGDLLMGMRQSREDIKDIENGILLARERLLLIEFRYLNDNVGQDARQDIGAWERQYGDVGSLARQLPELQRDFAEEVEVYEDQAQAVRKNLFKLEAFVEDQLARAAALDKYLSYSRESGNLSLDDEQQVRFKLEDERQLLMDGQILVEALSNELSGLDIRNFIRKGNIQAESRFRRQADLQMARARKDLRVFRRSVRGGLDVFAEIDAAFASLIRLERSLTEFSHGLTAIEASQVVSLRSDLEKIYADLKKQGEEARIVDLDTTELAGGIARRGFSRIHAHFSDLILQADFGETDVYWEIKEEKNAEIEENQGRRATELELLQEKFSGLQEGDL